MGLAACGGDGDGTPSGTTGATGGPPATPGAPLVVSNASTASVNGTLDKTLVAGFNESGISGPTGNFSAAGPNDYCRVAVYQMANSGDGRKYAIEVIFSKATKEVSFITFREDVTPSTFSTRETAPLPAAVVDIANRRIGFTNLIVGTTNINKVTLNGTLEYATNAVVADRPSCG